MPIVPQSLRGVNCGQKRSVENGTGRARVALCVPRWT